MSRRGEPRGQNSFQQRFAGKVATTTPSGQMKRVHDGRVMGKPSVNKRNQPRQIPHQVQQQQYGGPPQQPYGVPSQQGNYGPPAHSSTPTDSTPCASCPRIGFGSHTQTHRQKRLEIWNIDADSTQTIPPLLSHRRHKATAEGWDWRHSRPRRPRHRAGANTTCPSQFW